MLVISRKPGESLIISDNIRITLLSLSSDKVAIGIDAPKSVKVVREELLETIRANKESAGPADCTNIAAVLKSNNPNRFI